MAKKGTAVAKKDQSQLPAGASDFQQFDGMGMENVGATDLIVPRLTILQQMSPQVNKKKPEFIEGAEIGMICDVATGDFWEDGIHFLPVYFRKDYLEWAPRESGKGLQNIHSDPAILDQCERDDRNRTFLANGNQIIETAQWFGLNFGPGAGRRRSFIPMASTQLKKSRKWMTMATGEKLPRGDGTEYTPPLFYRLYHLTTADESNNEGDWSGWKINRAPALPEPDAAEILGIPYKDVMKEAMEFYTMLREGQARGDLESMRDEATGAGSRDPNGAM